MGGSAWAIATLRWEPHQSSSIAVSGMPWRISGSRWLMDSSESLGLEMAWMGCEEEDVEASIAAEEA